MYKIATTIAALLISTSVASAASIDVNTHNHILTFHDDNGGVSTYKVATGKPVSAWHGTQRISEKLVWPPWIPTASMRRKEPKLPAYVPGGPKSPLGARALRLGSTNYLIHGTNAPGQIGLSVSHGCIRMYNWAVIDLYNRAPIGTTVTVH
jgi:lipoprotein-anchoring transpeptidase ErfK/SrfK